MLITIKRYDAWAKIPYHKQAFFYYTTYSVDYDSFMPRFFKKTHYFLPDHHFNKCQTTCLLALKMFKMLCKKLWVLKKVGISTLEPKWEFLKVATLYCKWIKPTHPCPGIILKRQQNCANIGQNPDRSYQLLLHWHVLQLKLD